MQISSNHQTYFATPFKKILPGPKRPNTNPAKSNSNIKPYKHRILPGLTPRYAEERKRNKTEKRGVIMIPALTPSRYPDPVYIFRSDKASRETLNV